MKKTLTIALILFSYIGMGQVAVSNPSGHATISEPTPYSEEDTLTAERFIEDSIGNSYEIEYRYVMDKHDGLLIIGDSLDGTIGKAHRHYISIVNIIAYHGNKQKVIFSNIKAIYSPVECVADNRELWLKRLYEYQNKKR